MINFNRCRGRKRKREKGRKKWEEQEEESTDNDERRDVVASRYSANTYRNITGSPDTHGPRLHPQPGVDPRLSIINATHITDTVKLNSDLLT